MLKRQSLPVCALVIGSACSLAQTQEYEVTPVFSVGSLTPGDDAVGDRVGEVLVMNEQYLVIGAPGTDIEGLNDAGVVYVYDTETESLLHTLQAPSPDASDEFGSALALDGGTIAIGAKNDDDLVLDGGAVYLFDALSGTMIEKLYPDDPEDIDRFGFSIAMNGSYICVSVINDNEAGTNAGSMEVFDRATRKRIGKLTLDEGVSINAFGYSCAISGHTLAVGAPAANITGILEGGAAVFDLTTMSQMYFVQGSDTVEDDQFGLAVAVSSDRLYVGAQLNSTDADRSGAAYMFDLASGDELIRMRPHDIRPNARFGSSLSVDGDHLIIGARRNSSQANNAGRTYLFNARTGHMMCRLGHQTVFTGEQFGIASAVLGDRAYVSALRAPLLGNVSGVAYRYQLDQFVFPDRTFIGRDCQFNDHDTLGLAIDLDGDLLVASGIEAGSRCVEDDTGGFFLYEVSTMTELHAVSQGVANNPDDFGWSVALDEGVIAVGAPAASDQVNEGGAVHLYDAITGLPVREISPDDVEAFDNFGYSVEMHQGLLAVGSPYADIDGQSNAGKVYLFDVATGGLVDVLIAPTPFASANFGTDIHFDASLLVIGAPGADESALGLGAVYVFDPFTRELVQTLATESVSARLGGSVYTDGQLVIAGDPNAVNDTGTHPDSRAGAIHVFDLETGSELARLFAFSEEDVQFGWDVALDDKVIYAGKRFRLTNFNSDQPLISPRVERFDRTTFALLPQIRPSYSSDHAWFGQSLAVNEQYVVAGMPNAAFTSSGSSRGGAVFVYDKPQGVTCPVDLNTDGALNFFDVSAFLIGYSAGDLAMDFNGDGNLNFFDVSAFLIAYQNGCP